MGELPDITCYEHESLAINLENSISIAGTCGNGPNDNRCDDGQCCSSAGFCGPEIDGYDSDGNIQYIDWDSASDGSLYYSSESAAFDAYCVDPLGDWRIDETNSCVDDNNNNNPDVTSTTITLTEYGEYSGAGSLFRGGYFMNFVAFGFMYVVYCLLL